jgi:hypothetical protein
MRSLLSGIRELLNAVKLIYQHCPPESLLGTLTVVLGLKATPQTPAIGLLGSPTSCADYRDIGGFLISNPRGSHALVEIAADRSFRLLCRTADIDLAAVAQTALVYHFDGTSERILAKRRLRSLGFPSLEE